ncbi:hypothetical protein P7C73_g664, partial [Tremellales sp. Uapishka_1]
MDTIESLAKQASQLTMYDLKSYYTQAKNMVLNVSEMEAKVREATNEDAWGASSTLMQEIAAATNNFAQFNEIMPTIYARFMEKEAREWRQIYKALTLLEYLVKHGSERVVDDARAHISTVKMLRSFHYIDEKGKDQGINVRNRASEIAQMLGDVEKIRQERRKAKANKNKYGGTGNDGSSLSFTSASGGRYGGFGSETVGGVGPTDRFDSGEDYRPRGSTFRDTTASAGYDEYEGADDFEEDQPPASSRRSTSISARPTKTPTKAPPKAETKVEPIKEVNLFDFGDDDIGGSASAPISAPAPVPAAGGFGDDDFDDFQQAPSVAPTSTAPSPAAAPKPNNIFDLLDSAPSSSPQVQSRAPALSLSQPPMYTSQPSFTQPAYSKPQPAIVPATASRPSYTSATSPKPAAAASTFDDLWATSLSSVGGTAPKVQTQNGGKTIKDLEKEKAMSGLWGNGQPAQQQQQKPAGGSLFDDLLL